MGNKPRTTLSPRQARFVERYIATAAAKQSAIDAGYARKNAQRTATRLLKLPDVETELAKHRNEVIATGKYSYEKAMAEAEQCFEFAKQTENASAMVKAAELRSKLSGLLIDRLDVRAKGSFQINICGIDDTIEAKPAEDSKKEISE